MVSKRRLVISLVLSLLLAGMIQGITKENKDYLEKSKTRKLENTISSEDRRVVYIDFRDVNWSNPEITIRNAIDAGYNVVILAFWMYGGAADMALAWQSVSSATKIQLMAYVHQKNSIVLVSCGGSTELPFLSASGTSYGNAVGSWAVANYLDGVDFDLENIGPGFTYGAMSSSSLLSWICLATVSAKQAMSSQNFYGVISHAPQAPYFGKIGSSSQNPWTLLSGGYSAVYASCGIYIDWFNVQFYNQGSTCYTTYDGLFVNSYAGGCNSFPGTSVTEIFSYGIPLSKIVVGKYNLINDASNGFISASLLGVYFSQAYSSFGWKAGVMVWAWQQSSSALWISQSWISPKPVQNITPKIASTTTTSSSKKPSTPTVKDSTTPLPSIITTSSYSDTINRNLFVSNRKVVYIDYRDINWSNPAQSVADAIDGGYNVIVIAFWLFSAGALDMAVGWQNAGNKNAIITYAHSRNSIVMVSAGGDTEIPYVQASGTIYGTAVGIWAADNHLDGVDFDLENFSQGLSYGDLMSSDQIINWISDATIACKKAMLSKGLNGFISHAPQAPYFGKIGSNVENPWTLLSGGYTAVYRACGNYIDWFNVQFYNQGAGCYTTFNSLFVNSFDGGKCPYFSGTSVIEISSYDIPLSKIVVGKYNIISDASNGFLSPTVLGSYFYQAFQTFGWNAGVMVWCWGASTSPAWIRLAWPFPDVNVLPTSSTSISPQKTVSPSIVSTTSLPTTLKTLQPTSSSAPVLPPMLCSPSEPAFICGGCDLLYCVHGKRVRFRCAKGTVCINSICNFGICRNNQSFSTLDVALNKLQEQESTDSYEKIYNSQFFGYGVFSLVAMLVAILWGTIILVRRFKREGQLQRADNSVITT